MATMMRLSSPLGLSKSLENNRLCISRAKFLQVGKHKYREFRRIDTGTVRCTRSELSVSTSENEAAQSDSGENGWIPVVPLSALPRGERRLIKQNNKVILLLWYKNDVYAIENKSPAEGAYSEGFFNAKLTADGCIVCPLSSSTFSLKTGEIKDWFPGNPVMRFVVKPLRKLITYPVKMDSGYIYIGMEAAENSSKAEIVFSGETFAGKTASDVTLQEGRIQIEERSTLGFTSEAEIVNGRSAMLGFSVLLLWELFTGKGFLLSIGLLDYIYSFL